MIAACMLGSFMVATHSTPSRMVQACSTYRENRSFASALGPSACLGEPLGGGEVLQGDDGGDPAVQARVDDATVVGELRPGEPSADRLDARPLEAESVGREAGVGQQLDVLGVAVVAVAGVAGQLHARHQLLACPPVAVDVVAFDLVPGRSRAPQEVLGESGHLRSSRSMGCDGRWPPSGRWSVRRRESGRRMRQASLSVEPCRGRRWRRCRRGTRCGRMSLPGSSAEMRMSLPSLRHSTRMVP